MPEVTLDRAWHALSAAGISIREIRAIGEGSNHFIFSVQLADGRDAICKFARTRATEQGIVPPNTDTLFGGQLSLDREAYLFRMIRERCSVPTPLVYGIHPSAYGTFLLLETMPGVPYKQFLRDSGFSEQAFLESLRKLGHDFAAVQNIRFPTFGNVMAGSAIEPAGLTNFADRWQQVLEMRIRCAEQKYAFDEDESKHVRDFFLGRLETMRPGLNTHPAEPVLIFTDMHAENFFVDKDGRPSGYFDLESAQAAPAALEFYGFRFFLFNFYDAQCFVRAEEAFFDGYRKNGGKYAPKDPFDDELIDFLAACRLLELTNSYWGHIDGIRDCWGAEMKRLLHLYMHTGKVDYMAVGDIWRQRDHQPHRPLLP